MPWFPHAAIRSILRKFAASEGGNIAVIFAVSCIPLLAAMGVAVDYSRASRATTSMQDALDAASLALSRQSNLNTMTQSQIQTFVADYFKANFHDPELEGLVVNAAYSPSGPSVTVSATGTVPTQFMQLLGKPDGGHRPHLDDHLGPVAAARGAGARQYRVDGVRRQDDGSQGGHARPAHPIAERGDAPR